MDSEAIGDAARQAFRAAFAGDTEILADRLTEIAGHGPQAIHAAVMGWSAITLKAMTGGGRAPAGTFYGLEVEDERTGETVGIDRLAVPDQQASQLVSMYGNNDDPGSVAIVKQACAGEDFGANLMVASVGLAAAAARGHLEVHAANCPGCSKETP